MDIPREKNAASPATGAVPRVSGQAGPAPPQPEDWDEDIAISDDVFEQPAISLPPRTSRRDPPKRAFRDLNPPPADVREGEPRTSKKKPFEKRSGAEAPKFRRLMIRPQTSLAAHVALDHARAESPVDMEKIDRGVMQFGKIHPHTSPDYRPNRLFRVLDGIYTHSPLKWLDFVDRTGARFLASLLVFLVVGGVVAWRYFGSLTGHKNTGAGAKEVVLSTNERVERGRTAVKGFLAAQNVETRLPFVLNPEGVAEKMRQFYDARKDKNPATIEWSIGNPVAGEHGAWLPFTFKDAAGRKVTVVMGEDDKGCRIDWENFVAFGEIPWQEFCRTRPKEPKSLRVRLRRVEQYEVAYPKDVWQSYEIEHRSGAPVLLGFAGRNGRAGQALTALVKGEQWQSALVYLRFDAGAKGYLVNIDEVVRTRWQDELTTWTNP